MPSAPQHFAQYIAPRVRGLPAASLRRLSLLWACRALRRNLPRALPGHFSPKLRAELRSLPVDLSGLDLDRLSAQLRLFIPKLEGVVCALIELCDDDPVCEECALDMTISLLEDLQKPVHERLKEVSIWALMIARSAMVGETEERQQINDVESALRMELA